MHRMWLVASAAALLAAVACSGSDGSERAETAPSSSTTASSEVPSTTTSTAPPPLSTADAAARYLAIVEPYNVALEALEAGINGGEPVESLRGLGAAVAGANATHVQELRSTVWPAMVQPAVGELVAASEQAQTWWDQAAAATTRDAVIAAAQGAIEHDGGDASATIRSLLGLDAYDEDDVTG